MITTVHISSLGAFAVLCCPDWKRHMYSLIHNAGGRTLKPSDDLFTGFRLPKTMLAAVDSICAKHDLTRSQLFRRSIMEYLSRQHVTSAEAQPLEPQPSWPAELFEHQCWKSQRNRGFRRALAIWLGTVFSVSPSGVRLTRRTWSAKQANTRTAKVVLFGRFQELRLFTLNVFLTRENWTCYHQQKTTSVDSLSRNSMTLSQD